MVSKNSQTFSKQYFAAIFVNFLSISYGITIGWTSPTIPILQAKDSPLESGPATIEQISWVTSCMNLGGLLATLTYSFVSNKLGRKLALYIIVIPQTFSWLIIEFSTNVVHLYVARFLGGFAGGALMTVIPVFVTEIADTRIRGRLGSLFAVTFNLGILIGYVIGSYLHYFIVPIIPICITVVFVIAFYFVQESPTYLLSKKKFKEADKAIQYYTGVKTNDADSEKHAIEVKNLLQNQEKINEESKLRLKDFRTPYMRKATLLALFLGFYACGNGCFVILSYSQSIFEQSGSSLSSATSSIIVASVQLFGSILGVQYIDHYGRKFLLIVSSVLSALTFIVLGGYSFIESQAVNVENFKWIPIASLSFLIFVASFGTMSVPFATIPELLPDKIRGIITAASMFVLWLAGFIQLRFYPLMLATFGVHICMWFYAVVCSLGTVIIIFTLPETRGKSAIEIKELLSK